MDVHGYAFFAGVGLLLGVALAPLTLILAAHRLIGRALLAWISGIVLGATGLVLSFRVNQLQFAAAEAAGHRYNNDMPGYGQMVYGAVGLLCYAGLFVLMLLIYAVSVWTSKARR